LKVPQRYQRRLFESEETFFGAKGLSQDPRNSSLVPKGSSKEGSLDSKEPFFGVERALPKLFNLKSPSLVP